MRKRIPLCFVSLFIFSLLSLFAGYSWGEITYSYQRSFNTADIEAEISVNDLFVFHNKLYSSHSDYASTYVYDGSSWAKSGDNTPWIGSNPSVGDFYIYDDGNGDALFAGVGSGSFGAPGAIYKYGEAEKHWNVFPPPPGPKNNPYRVKHIQAYNGKLYCDGKDTVSGEKTVIYQYTPGIGWVESYKFEFKARIVNDFCIFDNGSGEKLYVATSGFTGFSDSQPGQIYVFDGTNWSLVYTTPKGYSVDSLCKYNGELYFSSANSIGVYNGTIWSDIKYLGASAVSLCVWNNKLFAAVGKYGLANKKLYVYDGVDWKVAIDFSSMNPAPLLVSPLAVYKNKLYIGMRFAPYRAGMTNVTSAQIFEITQQGGPKYKEFGFEDGVFSPLTTSGNANWQVNFAKIYSGVYSAKAGTITHNQSTNMELKETLSQAGTISFARKVSSEANHDYLRFYIDGVEKGKWSGETGWKVVSYGIAAGAHTFKWTYKKDFSVNKGSNTAWVDDVNINGL